MMTHVRKLLVLGCICLFGQLSFSQENFSSISYAESFASSKLIEGYISAEDSTVLVGALIRIPGTSIGTLADDQGYFQLNVPKEQIENDSLEISYLTMSSRMIPLAKIEGPLQIELKYLSLDELDITSVPVCCFVICTPGRVGCGLNITTVNSPLPTKIVTQPEQFAHGKLIIRSQSSISSQGPLYVVDGIPYTEISGSPLNTLAPENIKEITFIRGDIAAAIYGCRGFNGVILITTNGRGDFYNQKYFTYSSLLGLAQLEGSSLQSSTFTHSQFLKFTQTTPSYKFNVSANVRELPGFEENQSRKHFGGNVFYSRLAIDQKLEIGGRLSINHIREKTPALADVVKKNNTEDVEYSLQTFNNYFSQAFARYKFSDLLKANIDLSSYQNENLLFDRMGGKYVKPRINLEKNIGMGHQIKAETYISAESLSGSEQSRLQQIAGGLKAEYEYDRIFEAEVNIRKEANSLLSQDQKLPAHYLNTRVRANYDNLELLGGSICAYSRGFLQAQANVNQTPFFSQNTFTLETQIGIGQQFSLNAGYTLASEQKALTPIPQEVNFLSLFPVAYQVLQNQGLEMSISFYENRGGFMLDSRLDYHRGNGLAKEMMSFNNRLEWRRLSFESGIEGFRGWKLSGGERDFFRLSFLDFSYNLNDIPQLNLRNVKLSLSGQNLIALGDQQVWKDQLELSRLRDPSQFPVPLARNLLLGLKMDLF